MILLVDLSPVYVDNSYLLCIAAELHYRCLACTSTVRPSAQHHWRPCLSARSFFQREICTSTLLLARQLVHRCVSGTRQSGTKPNFCFASHHNRVHAGPTAAVASSGTYTRGVDERRGDRRGDAARGGGARVLRDAVRGRRRRRRRHEGLRREDARPLAKADLRCTRAGVAAGAPSTSPRSSCCCSSRASASRGAPATHRKRRPPSSSTSSTPATAGALQNLSSLTASHWLIALGAAAAFPLVGVVGAAALWRWPSGCLGRRVLALVVAAARLVVTAARLAVAASRLRRRPVADAHLAAQRAQATARDATNRERVRRRAEEHATSTPPRSTDDRHERQRRRVAAALPTTSLSKC